MRKGFGLSARRGIGLIYAVLVSACSLQSFDYLSAGLEPTSSEDSFDETYNTALEPESTGQGRGGGNIMGKAQLLENPDFELGYLGWYSFDFASLRTVTNTSHGGTAALLATDRARSASGVAVRIRHLVTPGMSYEITGWFRVDDGEQTLNSALKVVCLDQADGEQFEELDAALLNSTWQQMSTAFLAPLCDMDELMVIFDGPDPGVDFFVDDVTMTRLH